MNKPKINLWRLIPAAIAGARAGLNGIAEATAEESDGGRKVTKAEAKDIAEAVGKAVAERVLADLLKDAD